MCIKREILTSDMPGAVAETMKELLSELGREDESQAEISINGKSAEGREIYITVCVSVRKIPEVLETEGE